MKIKILLCLVLATLGQFLFAQTQQGYVKTLGRPEKKGEALGGVTIRVKGEHNPVVSKNDGTFSILMANKKNGDAYILQQVQKNGYELNEKDLIGRQFAFSDNVPLTIVMVSFEHLQAAKQRIENNAYKTAEKNYKAKYNQLEKQLSDNEITAEQYRVEIQNLQDKFEKYQSLIDGLAEHYVHTDYDELDEKDREINICIENGELERADSLIHLLFDPISVLKRNKEALATIEQQIGQANAIIGQANEDLAAVLKQQEKDAEHLYQLFTIALSRYDNEKALFYIETRAALDTTNIEWLIQAGRFLDEYIADYAKALSYFQSAAKHAIKQYGEQSGWVATIENNIAVVHSRRGEYAKTIEHQNKALTIHRAIFGENSPNVATCYNNIGTVYSEQGDYAKALEYYNKALSIHKAVYGENHYEVAACYNNIGIVYDNKGDHAKALDYHLQALNIHKSIFGDSHPKVALSYNNIGNVYIRLGNYDKALEYYNMALDIYKTVYGNSHPDIAMSYNNMGMAYDEQGLFGNAIEYYQMALDIDKAIHGENHPNVATNYNNIGSIYYKLAYYDMGLEYYNKAINIYTAVFGEIHPHVANGLNNIGTIYSKIGDNDKALEYFNKALAIANNVYGENHPTIAHNYNNIGYLYYSLKDYTKALEYYNKALTIQKATYGENHPNVAISYNNIAVVYSNQGDYSKALEYHNKALPIRETLLGENHPDIAMSYHNMGIIYDNLGDYDKGLEYYNKALGILRTAIGEDHPDVVFIKNVIAIIEYRNALNNNRLGAFCEDHCFTATPLEGKTASQQGMSGTYILLELGNWNQDSPVSFFDVIKGLGEKPYDILVMNNGIIEQHHFEESAGMQYGFKRVGKDEKQRINRTYEEWKKQNR